MARNKAYGAGVELMVTEVRVAYMLLVSNDIYKVYYRSLKKNRLKLSNVNH